MNEEMRSTGDSRRARRRPGVEFLTLWVMLRIASGAYRSHSTGWPASGLVPGETTVRSAVVQFRGPRCRVAVGVYFQLVEAAYAHEVYSITTRPCYVWLVF